MYPTVSEVVGEVRQLEFNYVTLIDLIVTREDVIINGGSFDLHRIPTITKHLKEEFKYILEDYDYSDDIKCQVLRSILEQYDNSKLLEDLQECIAEYKERYKIVDLASKIYTSVDSVNDTFEDEDVRLRLDFYHEQPEVKARFEESVLKSYTVIGVTDVKRERSLQAQSEQERLDAPKRFVPSSRGVNCGYGGCQFDF